MLSRVDDARVFESSEDVVIRSSSRRNSRHHQLQLRNRVADDQTEIEEDEQLHPQHPYRMRKRVLQQEYEDFHQLKEENDKMLVPSRSQESNRPMEFVFLSSGEIRAREDCPPGLELPKLQHYHNSKNNRRLEYRTEDYLSGESEQDEDLEYQSQNTRSKHMATTFKHQNRRQRAARQYNVQYNSSPSSSSHRSESSVSEDADISSDDNESIAEEIEQRLKRLQAQNRKATRNTESRDNARKRSAARMVRNSARNTPTRSLELDHLREMSEHDSDRIRPSHHSASSREEKSPSSDVSRESRHRPAPLEQLSPVSQLDTNDVQAPTKRSPKMEVSHLASNEPTPTLKDGTLSSAKKEETVIGRLESELQKEKKRVLEKMTQLLDEQGKNQQLRDRIEALESQLAAKDSEASNKLQEAEREREIRLQSSENRQADRINALEEQARVQEAMIARLKQDKDQLKAAIKQLKTTSGSSNGQSLDSSDAKNLRTELDDMTRLLHEFLARLERWKLHTKNELLNCRDVSDLPALIEQKWHEFPQYPEVSTRPHKDATSPCSDQQLTSGTETQDAVLFLKKRLRQREEELRQTHVKFGELKEICARQCVREADLQNFINEHRLRGNLIIRRSSDTKPNEVVSNQDPVQDEDQEDRRNGKLKMISSRGTNTPAPYNDEDNFVNDEYSDNQEDNDYEEVEDDEHPVRTPKVFVQVGRDGVYERSSSTDSAVAQKLAADRKQGKRKKQQRVERIRLVPSPSLAQRYERVPTPTTTARRKTSTQHLVQASSARPSPVMLGQCPPGCGSRPSYMNRKTPTSARVKAAKTSVSTSTSRGAVGVVRPWM